MRTRWKVFKVGSVLSSSYQERTVDESNENGSPGHPDNSTGSVASAFNRILDKSSVLYKGNPEVLRENYVPARLLHRDREIERIVEILAPALKGATPSNIMIYGKIGTGKTAVITLIRKDMERRQGLPKPLTFITVNCANVDTHYALLQTLGNAVAELEESRIPTGWSLDRVYVTMRSLFEKRGGTILLILDEIDKLVKRSGDNVLYTLSQVNSDLSSAKVGIIGISNDLKFTDSIDARVRSRMNEEKILFPPYDWTQLRDILRDRVQEVFGEDVVEAGVIERCAVYAAQENGDARRALALLRVSAQIAERTGSSVITEEHVHRAKASLETDIITDCVRTLPVQCKILLWSIVSSTERRRVPLPTGEVYDGYADLCSRMGITALTTRSIFNYISEMETLGLIHTELLSRGRGGRYRQVTIAVPAQETLHALEEDAMLMPLSKQRVQNQRSLYHYDGNR
jgi:cell division control protein 6